MSKVLRMKVPKKTSRSMQKRYNLRMMEIIRKKYKSQKDIPVCSAEELRKCKESN